MTKLKWILRDCNIYIALLFVAVSFCPSIAAYQPLILCFSLLHIFKIIKMLKDKVFLISDFNLILALTCFIPLAIDFHINAYTFSLFLIIPVSLKTLLFTKISKLTLKHYLNQHNLAPDFTVIVQNDLKDYLFSGRQSTISHYLYLDDIEFRLTDSFKGVFFSKKLIPFTYINGYCTKNGIEYCDLKKDDMYRMSMLIGS
jgi:hypothetical protein